MKKYNLTLLFCFLLMMNSASALQVKNRSFSRLKYNINRDWKFILGDNHKQPASVCYDDSNWDCIGLPHSFSIPYFRSNRFYIGYGWYRKNIEIRKEWLGKNIRLEFDGVFQVAEVYVNGKKVGEHQGGYTGFFVDISNYVSVGNNVIAVRVNNLWNPQLAPRAGEHVFSGGIYRDVYLSVADPVHVAWNGTFVSTPKVSSKEGTVRINTEIINSSAKSEKCLIKSIVFAPNGKKVATMETEQMILANSNVFVDQISKEIDTPQLWSPETPNLYRVKTLITINNNQIDEYESVFGFRWFEWTADNGFVLNGKRLFLEGANVHQDHAGWGDAVTKAGIYRDLKLMKDAGFNFIRGSHYPHHPYFTEVCDELGLIFLPENSVWGIGGFKGDGYWDSSTYPIAEKDQKPYEESAMRSLEELIRINRNSPSIMAWSMSNEPFFTASSVVQKMKQMLVRLVKKTNELDSTRPTLIGGAQRKGVDVLGEIAGYNGDGATLYRDPGFPSMVSEYGSCVADRPGNYTPCWGAIHKGEKPRWRSGHAIWCGFDHGSIAGKMGKMGIVDFARIPKRSWYWYRNYFRNIPPPVWPVEGIPKSLKLYADRSVINGTDATDDAHINVKVIGENGKHISNSPEVTLTIISGPGEFPTGRSITFKNTTENDIQILDGHAAIEFRSYEGGTTIIEATSEGLESTILKIETKGLPMYKEGVTKIVENRPYVDYAKKQTMLVRDLVVVSEARPTRTNSINDSHPSLANDGKKETIWIAQNNKEVIWWELDMENYYQVAELTFELGKECKSEVSISISDNKSDWVEIGKSKLDKSKRTMLKIKNALIGRFLQVKFINSDKKDIEVSEITVRGVRK
ncbi:beta-galactosidase [Prolixibacteraceae bacterium JC049]|nr:beta-galactosidase [Prolixibacteraceae bacterium JC049]